MRCIRYIAAVLTLAMAAALSVSCGGDDRPTSITLGGRGLTMNVAGLQKVDGLIYQDTDNNFYNVGPAMEGHHLIVARVTIWNVRSGILSININEESGLLEGTERERALPIDPYERRVKLDERPAALSEHLPFLWGPADLPQDFNIRGWMVFEAPDGMEVAQLKWEQVDVLRFPITLS